MKKGTAPFLSPEKGDSPLFREEFGTTHLRPVICAMCAPKKGTAPFSVTGKGDSPLFVRQEKVFGRKRGQPPF